MILRPLIGTKPIFALNMDYGHEAAHWWELPLTTLPHIATIGPAQKNHSRSAELKRSKPIAIRKKLYQARKMIKATARQDARHKSILWIGLQAQIEYPYELSK